MRLLEPLSGIKSAQGHALIHALFFLVSWTVSVDFCSADQPSTSPAATGHVAGHTNLLYETYTKGDLNGLLEMNSHPHGDPHGHIHSKCGNIHDEA